MKSVTETEYIYSLIAEGEHIEQDFKYEISDARKIARTLSAFANTQGGRLLIGVKDNGRIAGVRSDEEIYMIDAAARLYCRPEVNIEMKTYHIEGRTILIANVLPVEKRPVMACDENNKYWAYVRIADENILATPIHLQLWRQNVSNCPSVLAFTERERTLLELLSNEEECSVAHICRLMGARRNVIHSLLARFIHWGVVAMRYNGRGFVYRAI